MYISIYETTFTHSAKLFFAKNWAILGDFERRQIQIDLDRITWRNTPLIKFDKRGNLKNEDQITRNVNFWRLRLTGGK